LLCYALGTKSTLGAATLSPQPRSVTLALVLTTIITISFPPSTIEAQRPDGLRIVVIAGEDAVNIIQQKTAVNPIVEVRDRNDLPVSGVAVTFSVGSQGATFAGGASTLTLTTNAAGQAVATGLTPTASGAVTINATAVVNGQTIAATITQTNFATAQAAAQAGASAGASTSGASTTGATAAGGGGGLSGATLGILGGVAAAGAGAAVGLGKSDASSTPSASQPGGTVSTAGGATPTIPAPPTPPAQNRAPVINAATVTPALGLVAVTPVAFEVQATDPDNDQLTYLWEFPDGTRSDQRSFSRVLQLGGTHNSRITVHDGTTSTSREFSFEMKTLSGQWADSRGARVWSLVQNGSTVTGTMPSTDCALTGSLRAGAPQLILDASCRYTVNHNGQQIAHGTHDYHLELQLDAVMSGLSGTERVRTTNISLHGFVQNIEHTSVVQFSKR
jgi:hypothetical protein